MRVATYTCELAALVDFVLDQFATGLLRFHLLHLLLELRLVRQNGLDVWVLAHSESTFLLRTTYREGQLVHVIARLLLFFLLLNHVLGERGQAPALALLYILLLLHPLKPDDSGTVSLTRFCCFCHGRSLIRDRVSVPSTKYVPAPLSLRRDFRRRKGSKLRQTLLFVNLKVLPEFVI